MFQIKFIKRISLILFIAIISSAINEGCAQSTKSDLNIYVLTDRYGEDALNYFKENNFISSTLFTRSMIDPQKTGKVDLKVLTKNIEKAYPGRNDSGVCFVDWEEPFREMKKVYNNNRKFKVLEDEYLKIIGLFRQLRPNVKIAIYGIPFTAFKVSWDVMKANKNGRFDRILSQCDFISPAIYIRFPNEEVGEKSNIKYINDNLDVAFEYEKRLQKPIVPFIWPRVHPNNKKYGLRMLSSEEMMSYLNALKNYQHNGKKISGVIWFDPKITAQQRANNVELQQLLKERDDKITESLNILVN